MKKYYVLLLLFAVSTMQALGQGKITVKDRNEINFQATEVVRNFESLLNFVTFSESTPSELKEAIENSYKPNKLRIFYNKNIIVEDDIDPASKLGSTKELPAEKYLNDFDLQYQKSTESTISFSEFVISSVKQRDYVYVKVKFDSKYTGKHNIVKADYEVSTREALVRLESQGNSQWKAFITGITFYNPETPIESIENNAEILKDDSENASIVSIEELKREEASYAEAKAEEIKKLEANFTEFMDLASASLLNKRYKEALDFLEKAKAIKPMVPALEKKISDTRRLIVENTYENLKNKADLARRERRFIDAITLYKEALIMNPSAFAIIDAEIKPISKKVEQLAIPKGKLESQDFLGAINSCESILKDNKKIKGEFPELYFIQGVAYQSLFEKTPTEKKFREKSFENYNQAILFFSNYIEARAARAKFFVTYLNDPVSAIADYDVLTTNLMDAAVNKPIYFALKAKLKDGVNNHQGAIEDYLKAIALSPKTASFYCDLGELQYRATKFDLALKNLTTAIQLNAEYKEAYYYRGLNYVALKKSHEAGLDFIAAEKLNIDVDKSNVVNEISATYLKQGEEFLNKAEFEQAEIEFNNSLNIRNCNDKALFGKGEIRFLKAELTKETTTENAKSKYQEGIDFYQQAIKCNPSNAKANYKKGLSHVAKKEFDFAVISLTEAVRFDPAYTKAFISLGDTYQIIKQYQKASDSYNNAISLLLASYESNKKAGNKVILPTINTDISHVYQLNGEALYNMQQAQLALVSLNKALEYSEENSEARYYLGLIYYQLQDLSKAIKNFNEGLKFGKEYKYYFANAKAYFKNEDYDLAITNIDEGIKLDIDKSVKSSYYLKGLCYNKTKQWENASKVFAEYGTLKDTADNESYYSSFGLAQLHLNQDAEALNNFNKVLLIKSDNPQALYGLGCLHAKKGDFPKVTEYMEKAFTTRQIIKDQFKFEEETFLAEYMKVKANKKKLSELKKTYSVAK